MAGKVSGQESQMDKKSAQYIRENNELQKRFEQLNTQLDWALREKSNLQDRMDILTCENGRLGEDFARMGEIDVEMVRRARNAEKERDELQLIVNRVRNAVRETEA